MALESIETPETYEAHLEQYQQQYISLSFPEINLVNTVADAAWRLNRAARMEREFLEKYPNPFLEPNDPMALQLVRCTRYRNSIQRTHDRALKELQILIEAETRRRTDQFVAIR